MMMLMMMMITIRMVRIATTVSRPSPARPARERFFSILVPPFSRLVRFARGPDLLPWGASRIGRSHTPGSPDGHTDPSAVSRGSPVACLWPTQPSPASGVAQPGVWRDPARRGSPVAIVVSRPSLGQLASGSFGARSSPARPGPARHGFAPQRSTHGQLTVNTTVNTRSTQRSTSPKIYRLLRAC